MPDGFFVSLGDLREFGGQVDRNATSYLEIQAFTSHFMASATLPATGLPGYGMLQGAMILFIDDAHALLRAHHSAFGRFTAAMTETARSMTDTVKVYAELDAANVDILMSVTEQAPAPVIPTPSDAPTRSWNDQQTPSEFLRLPSGGLDRHLPKMGYDYKMSFGELMTTANDLWSDFPLGTVDRFVEQMFGFSLVKFLIRPLLGNWGWLWLLRDVFNASADAVEAVSRNLQTSTAVMVPDLWSGEAAHRFDQHMTAWRDTCAGHARELRETAKLFGLMGDKLDKDATAIAEFLIALGNIVINLIILVLSRGKAWENRPRPPFGSRPWIPPAQPPGPSLHMAIVQVVIAIIDLFKKTFMMGYHLGEAFLVASTDAKEWVKATDDLRPPRVRA